MPLQNQMSRNPTMHNNNLQQQQQQQLLNNNKNNMNFIQSQLQQQQPGNVNLQNSNSNNNSNNNSSSNTNQQTPHIQHHLIESFRLAVQAGLISPDLLNTKLPQEVLTLLYQLFQLLQHYMNTTNKIQSLQKRRTQLSPAQFTQEMDILTQESQSYKENLLILQKKINADHLVLKQQQQQQQQQQRSGGASTSPIQSSNSLNQQQQTLLGGLNNLNDPLMNDLKLNDNNNGPISQQRSKLLQLLGSNESSNGNKSSAITTTTTTTTSAVIGGGQSQKNIVGISPSSSSSSSSSSATVSSSQQLLLLNQQKQMQQINNNSSLFNYSSTQWSGLKFGDNSSMGATGFVDPQLPDDRITPFIPGQLWASQQISMEDDPNCTPGSVSKPLLTETIDPESILASHWSNTSIDHLSLIGNNSNFTGINQQLSNRSRNNTTSGNGNVGASGGGGWNQLVNNFSSQMSMPSQSTNANSNSIGEQLWGVRSSSRIGSSAVAMANASSAATLRNPLQNQVPSNGNQAASTLASSSVGNNGNQQFYRSSSWNIPTSGTPNVNGQQQQQQSHQLSNSQDSNRTNNMQFNNNNNGNFSITGGHFILIRNVSSQVN
jgi:hypothetical protein